MHNKQCHVDIHQLLLPTYNTELKGLLDLTLDTDNVQWSIHFMLPKNEYIKNSGQFFFPSNDFNMNIDYRSRLSLITAFMNTGSQEIDGDFALQGSITKKDHNFHTDLRGKLFNGTYNNYATAIHLKDIKGYIEGKKGQIAIKNIHSEGIFSADAKLLLNQKSYSADIVLERLSARLHRSLHTLLSGNIAVVGTAKKAFVKGALNILDGEFTLSTKKTGIERPIPIKYINSADKKSPFYKWLFDIDVHTSDKLHVKGCGVDSIWKGKCHIGGELHNLEVTGKYSLTKGSYRFSSHDFVLTNGVLSFNKTTSPFIRLSAETSLPDMNVLVDLYGNSDAIKFSLRSLPDRPKSVILSHLLFGQEISNVTPAQSVQIATALDSFVSGESNIFDRIKEKTHLDRLAITYAHKRTNSPNEDSQNVLEIGKYVSDGILFSVLQGPDIDRTNLSVEVFLPKGFRFKAETIREQQQGKASLKWSYRY